MTLSPKSLTICRAEIRDSAVILVQEYADIFAVSDLDLGNFIKIGHHIDTEDASLVKQQMFSAPTVFQGKEYGYLEKMLKVGVFQPSSSAWASAPVLVRKKDGSVRWCVDYLELTRSLSRTRTHCHLSMSALTH